MYTYENNHRTKKQQRKDLMNTYTQALLNYLWTCYVFHCEMYDKIMIERRRKNSFLQCIKNIEWNCF